MCGKPGALWGPKDLGLPALPGWQSNVAVMLVPIFCKNKGHCEGGAFFVFLQDFQTSSCSHTMAE